MYLSSYIIPYEKVKHLGLHGMKTKFLLDFILNF